MLKRLVIIAYSAGDLFEILGGPNQNAGTYGKAASAEIRCSFRTPPEKFGISLPIPKFQEVEKIRTPKWPK